jgi:hypothetical protein
MSLYLRHIILIPSQTALALKDKQQITNLIVIELTWPGLKPTIYCTWDEHFNHYTTDEVTRVFHVAVADNSDSIVNITVNVLFLIHTNKWSDK